jgi:excisionase family DNA binding protein
MTREDLVGTTEAARMLGVSRQRVSQLLLSGQLEGRRIGYGWMIPRASILRRLGTPPGRWQRFRDGLTAWVRRWYA